MVRKPAMPHLLDTNRVVDRDAYEQHFGAKTTLVSELSKASVDRRSWRSTKEKKGRLGTVITSVPDVDQASASTSRTEPDVGAPLPPWFPC